MTVPPDAHHSPLVRTAGFNSPLFMEKRLVAFARGQWKYILQGLVAFALGLVAYSMRQREYILSSIFPNQNASGPRVCSHLRTDQVSQTVPVTPIMPVTCTLTVFFFFFLSSVYHSFPLFFPP